jgi:hypothetical protein
MIPRWPCSTADYGASITGIVLDIVALRFYLANGTDAQAGGIWNGKSDCRFSRP